MKNYFFFNDNPIYGYFYFKQINVKNRLEKNLQKEKSKESQEYSFHKLKFLN